MKGNISLKKFIEDVKNELREASGSDDPFFIMDEVELEVSFALDTKGKAGGKFIVLELGGEVNASQIHKVKLKLTPFKEDKSESIISTVLQKRQLRRGGVRPVTIQGVERPNNVRIDCSKKHGAPVTCSLKKHKPTN